MARRTVRAGSAVLAAAASLVLVGVPGAPALQAPAALTIHDPGAPVAGPVTITGTVGAEADGITSVLYVVDATGSTSEPIGSDCTGDHVVNATDDLNGDGIVGDVLDCEIAGVNALNSSMAGTPGMQAGIVAFANDAAAADLDPTSSSATFVPPGYTGGDPRPRIDTVARSVVRTAIGLYAPVDLGGSGAGTAFNNAVQTALDTLAQAPEGPKWVLFLSDGQSPIDDALLDELTASGVHLRSFAVGADASCVGFGGLAKMARATGEACVVVSNPATLAAQITGSQPDAVNNVTVTIQDVSVAATLDAVGGWSAAFVLGAGAHTVKARAVFASGRIVDAQTTFTVSSAPGGPAPGVVHRGPDSLVATAVKARRPPPTRHALPPRVTGQVGLSTPNLQVTKKLAGARVLLQARTGSGEPWVTKDRDKVDKLGRFELSWNAKRKFSQLRVQLVAVGKYAASATSVPPTRISACRVTRHQVGWTVRCQTTASDGSAVRLLKKGEVVDTAKVHSGAFRVHGTGPVRRHVIDVTYGSQHHAKLHL
jgi:hypothetical protein